MKKDIKNNLKSRKVLGKGLAALLPEADESYKKETKTKTENNDFFYCPIESINPAFNQPRKNFDELELKELGDSIKENGLIQPLVVRKNNEDKYEIIAGERRWRACKKIGLEKVPVVLKNITDRLKFQTALVENIQRKDLSIIEEALAYKELITDYDMTQEELAKKVGKQRSSVTNALRILNLPDYVKKSIEENKITSGHGKILCSVSDAKKLKFLYNKILKDGLSVRKLEELLNDNENKKVKTNNKTKTTVFNSVEENLREKFQTKVSVKGKYEKGKFIIEYYSKDDFERILAMIS
jgi:ParB family transcriptional regulator, chromosome partitioning protein